MGQWPPPAERRPKAWDRLLAETLQVYRQALVPMVAAAVIGALITNLLIAAWVPDTRVVRVLWVVVASVPSFISQAAVTVIAWQVVRGERAEIGPAFAMALGLSSRYVAGTALILLVTQLSFLTIVGIPLGLFLLTRWALFGPAVVLERRGMGEALVRSWYLVTGKSWRTLAMVFGAGLAALGALLIARGLGSVFGNSLGAEIVFSSIALALVVPLGTTYFLLLFDDYRSLEGGGEAQPPS